MRQSRYTVAEALAELGAGHARNLAGKPTQGSGCGLERVLELTGGQAPYACILTSADSRVVPEYIFDAGLGELFVCRNAGCILDETTLGSFEYIVGRTGCPLLLVLGQTSCGLMGCAIAAADDPEWSESPHVVELVRQLIPAVKATRPPKSKSDLGPWLAAAARWHVRQVCREVLRRSGFLRELHRRDSFMIVGGIYDLATAQVSFNKPEWTSERADIPAS